MNKEDNFEKKHETDKSGDKSGKNEKEKEKENEKDKPVEDEPLLQESNDRLILFPIKYQKVWDFYQKAVRSFWKPDEVDLTADLSDWKNKEKVSINDQYFIKQVLAFFASSDAIVIENLAIRFLKDVKIPEARAFYTFQLFMEQIHSETYANLLDTYVTDMNEKIKLFRAIETVPVIKAKADWAFKWITGNSSFHERLIAFACVEGIFFSGSFCSIFWFKKRGLLPGLTHSNELISRDEGLHCDFACLLYELLKNKCTQETVHKIVKEAVQLEEEFVKVALPVSLIGMNSNLMKQYLEFVVDGLLVKFGYKRHFNVEQPFKFMEQIAVETKGNFFESRTVEYQKAKLNETLSFTDDF